MIQTFWHASDIAEPDLLIDLLHKQKFARRKNNLCLRADSGVAVDARQLLMNAADRLPRGSPSLSPPIRFHSGIFTLDKQRSSSVCPRSTSLPLLTKLQRADWNLHPPSRDILGPLTFTSHRAEPYINLIPGSTLQPLKQPMKQNSQIFAAFVASKFTKTRLSHLSMTLLALHTWNKMSEWSNGACRYRTINPSFKNLYSNQCDKSLF